VGGFVAVGVREIAEAAGVSTTTPQKHFPTKESLVFDRDSDIEDTLIAAVRDRPPGTSVLGALREYTLARVERVSSKRGRRSSWNWCTARRR
jgi:AcrR family transcriptional regulator